MAIKNEKVKIIMVRGYGSLTILLLITTLQCRFLPSFENNSHSLSWDIFRRFFPVCQVSVSVRLQIR